MKDVREAGSNHDTKMRVAIVPRFIVEPTSHELYIKLAKQVGLQKLVIKKILATVEEYGLDGIVLEMTDGWAVLAQYARPEVRNDLNAFVMRLGSGLHEVRKQLILVVRPMFNNSPYFQHFDFKATSKFVDGFSLMVRLKRERKGKSQHRMN